MKNPPLSLKPYSHADEIGYLIHTEPEEIYLGKVFHTPEQLLWRGKTQDKVSEFCCNLEEAVEFVVVEGVHDTLQWLTFLQTNVSDVKLKQAYQQKRMWLEILVSSTLLSHTLED